jgi:cytochrome c6
MLTTISLLAVCLLAVAGAAEAKKGDVIDGAKKYKDHCAVCHPDGGNIINKNKTLKKGDLAASGIKDWKGIVRAMRNPGPGMTRFDEKTIPENDAKAIAEYVLKTFK